MIEYMQEWPRRHAKRRKQAARRARFILANGLDVTPRDGWWMKVRGVSHPGRSAALLDHVHSWTRNGQVVCVTLQPYLPAFRSGGGRAALGALRDLGLTVRERGVSASWWNPGQTILIEVWAPGEEEPP